MIYLALTALFIAFCLYRERQWTAERDKLLDRIQAPEKAKVFEPTDMLPNVGYDDDSAYWLAKHDGSD